MNKQRKIALSAGNILLVLLVISIGFGAKRRIDLIRQKKISEIENKTTYAIEQAKSLSSLSPGRARSLILGAQKNIQEELENTKDGYVRSRLTGLSINLKNTLNAVGHIIVSNPELYLDLGLIREGASGSTMSLLGDKLFVLDRNTGVLLALSTVNRSGEVVGGGGILADAQAIYGSEKHAYVLTDHSVIQVSVDGKTSTPIITDEEGIWKEPIDIAFFSGNIYILDKGTSELYKYPSSLLAGGSGFGSRRRWFNPGVTPDLSQALGFSIDGDAWILFRDGTVKRFRQGTPVRFSMSGADEFGEAASFSVPTGGSRIWILDRGNGRVIAFNREDGEYVGQWTSDIMKESSSLAVSEEQEKMFLLVDKKVYVAGIQ